MDFVYHRGYRGPVKLVIFDWAGTTMDYGCYAPAVVFIEVFKRRGVEITAEKAKKPARTHWDMLLERRSIAELEELLAERLELLHGPSVGRRSA